VQQSGDHPLEDVEEVAISPKRFSQNLAINQKKLRSTIFYLALYIFAYTYFWKPNIEFWLF
jgi:streptomycin 6-kinase